MAISSLQLHMSKQDTIIDRDTNAFADQHEGEFPGTADAQLRGISSQTAAEQTTEHQRAARHGDIHDPDKSNDLRSRQFVTSVQPQVQSLLSPTRLRCTPFDAVISDLTSLT